MHFVAAVSDAWAIGWPIALCVLMLLNGVITGILARQASRIDSIEKRLYAKADELIEMKFQAHASILESSCKILNAAISTVQNELKEEKQETRTMLTKLGDMELRAANREGQLKDWIHKECVTMDDLAAVNGRFDKIENLIRCGGKPS
jgi:septal ring factor EnvC (AmiA/AmiB activator)